MDDITHVIVTDLHQRGDVPDALALAGHHHHNRPPQLDRILRSPRDPLQLAAFLHRQRPDEHFRSASHDHLHVAEAASLTGSPHEINYPANVQ
ncbi:hypothetical protein ACFFHJ_07195 [Planotetraspora thailandica]|uniref:hypothetical protein n=1 Tax=Planotetraspora thailandica TaxID=487172 RepID=UPI001EF28995|nr:hypothetical protein [Planotetraspora thailandica]